MSSAGPENGGAATAATNSNAPGGPTTTASQPPATTTTAPTTSTPPPPSSTLSTSTTSSTSESSVTDSSSLLSSLSSTSSETPLPTPKLPEPAPAPIQSSKQDEHLARNICLGIFLLFAVVGLIGFAYWGIPRLIKWREDRKSRQITELPFSNDEAKGSSAAHRSAMLLPGRSNSIVSFDSRSPAEKSKSNENSPASLAFSPPISPKSPALWTEQGNNNTIASGALARSIIPDATDTNNDASNNAASQFATGSLRQSRSTMTKMIPRSAAPTPPPQRPLSRPPPLDMEDVPRAVFYNHPGPSMTTVASYPYEDEDSSLWAFVPPLSPFGVNRPSSPPVSQMPNSARRDSDTYPRTPYL